MRKNIKILLFVFQFVALDIVLVNIIDFDIIRIIFLMHMYVCVHEISHMIAYIVQGIEVYSITIFPIKIYCNEKTRLKLEGFKGYLGIVIPKIENVSSDKIESYRDKIKFAIISAVYMNFCLSVFYFILSFKFFDKVIIMSILINLSMFVMAFSKNDYVSGDVIAYNNIKRDIRCFYLYIYTYCKNNDEYSIEDKKMFITTFESLIVWSEYDVNTKKILYNIFEEQLQLEELCISKDFIENVIANFNILIEAVIKKKYIDYVICNKLILILIKYRYLEKAKQLYDCIKDIFPVNPLIIESRKQLGLK